MCSSQYPAFLDHMMKIFLKILQEGEPHFISEYNIQQVRKLILEMIHRLPSNEYLRPYVRQILTLIFKLLETDNEENVLVCLRIIIDLHKQYKPTFNPEVSNINFIHLSRVNLLYIRINLLFQFVTIQFVTIHLIFFYSQLLNSPNSKVSYNQRNIWNEDWI